MLRLCSMSPLHHIPITFLSGAIIFKHLSLKVVISFCCPHTQFITVNKYHVHHIHLWTLHCVRVFCVLCWTLTSLFYPPWCVCIRWCLICYSTPGFSPALQLYWMFPKRAGGVNPLFPMVQFHF